MRGWSVFFMILSLTLLPTNAQPEVSIDPVPTNPSADGAEVHNRVEPEEPPGQAPTVQSNDINQDEGIEIKASSEEGRRQNPHGGQRKLNKEYEERTRKMREMREEYERKKKERMGEPEKYINQNAESLTPTQRKKAQELKKMKNLNEANFKSVLQNTENVRFQIGYSDVEFILTYHSDVDVIFMVNLFTQDSGTMVYGTKDIEQSGALRVEIYEDGMRNILGTECYFMLYETFKARKGVNYTVRFSNKKMKKLVNFGYNFEFYSQDLQNLIDMKEGGAHIGEINSIFTDFQNIMENLRRSNALEFVNSGVMEKKVKNYSLYQFFEILVVVGVTVLQVQLIKKMLKGSSIV